MISIDLDHFRARILQDALTEATAQYWVHRAHQFQQAAPRLGKFHGDATRESSTKPGHAATQPRKPACSAQIFSAATTPNRSATKS